MIRIRLLNRLFAVALTLWGSVAMAQTTYYISSVSGSDANNGTSEATAFKTVGPVKANYAGLVPGTSVLFKRGEKHPVSDIRPTISGTPASPVVFGAYGTGENPVLTGATLVTGFTDAGGGVYSAPLSSSAVVRLVFNGGARQPIARHPNTGFFYTTSIPTSTTNANVARSTFIDNTRTEPTGYWVGADVGIRFEDWEWFSARVSAYDGTTKQFTLNAAAYGNLRATWGYFFTNKRELLDAPGEWHQSGSTLFYMPPSGTDPTTLTLQAATSRNAFFLRNVNHIHLVNLTLEKYASDAIYADNTLTPANPAARNEGLQIRNVVTASVYTRGLQLLSSSNTRIENCRFLDSEYEGVGIQNCTGTEMLNSQVRRTGLVPGLQYRAGGGIIIRPLSSTVQGSNNRIVNCVVDSSGKHGIRLDEGQITIEKSIISNSALNTSDIGGIYLISAACKNIILRQNFVSATGSYTGGVPLAFVNESAARKGRGLYVDDFAQDVLMEDNTSYNNTSFGIHLINGKNVTLRRNLTFGNGVAEINFSEANSRSPRVPVGFSKHTVEDNTFIATNPQFKVVNQETQEYNGSDFGTFDNNFYHHPTTPEVISILAPRHLPTPYTSPPVAGAITFKTSTLLTLPEFRAFSGGQDATSKRSKFRFDPFTVTGMLSENLIDNGTFEGGLTGWTNEAPADFTLSLQDALNGKALSYKHTGPTLVNRRNFTYAKGLNPDVTPGDYFRLTFTLRAAQPYATLQPFFAQTISPFATSGFIREVPARVTAETQKLIFQVTGPTLQPSSVLKFAASVDAGEYFLDDVSLQKVQVTPNDRFRQLLLANPSETPRTFDVAALAGNQYPFTFFDKDSLQVGSTVTVPAWSSRVVFALAEPLNTAPVASSIANQTATVGQIFSLTVPAFTDAETPNQLTYNALDLPTGLTFDPNTRVIAGVPGATGVSSVTITATDAGNLSASTSFIFTVDPFRLVVLHRDPDNGQLINNTLKPYFQLANESDQSVPYREITVRYWLTVENPVPLISQTNYVQLGSSNVQMRYVPISPVRSGADGYLEYSFGASAGTLGTGSNSGDIQSSVFKQDYSSFDQGNDYSYVLNRDFAPNARITAYRNGALVYGTEPGAAGGRLAAETANELQIRVLRNPVLRSEMAVDVLGAAGQPVQLRVTDLSGHVVSERFIEQAGAVERQRLSIDHQPAGLLFLRVSTPTQGRTVKVLKGE